MAGSRSRAAMTLIECMIAFAIFATAFGALISYQYTIGQVRRQSLVTAVRTVAVNSLANLMLGSYAPELASASSPWSYGRSKNLTPTQLPMNVSRLAQYHVVSPETGSMSGNQLAYDYDFRVYVEYYRSMDHLTTPAKKGLLDANFATPQAWRNALATSSSDYEVIMPGNGMGGLPPTTEVYQEQPILIRIRLFPGLTAPATGDTAQFEIFTGVATN